MKTRPTDFIPRVRLLSLAILCMTVRTTPAAEPIHITADFLTAVDYPLSKSKFAVFNSGMVRPARYERDADLIGAVCPESLRIDIGWGAGWIGWKTPAIFGTADAPQYDFTEMDRTAVALRSRHVPVYWSYCYTPRPLQPKPGDYKGMPTDLAAYRKIIHDVTAHYRNLPGGDPVGYHEIGNEPDNRDFFTGSREEYLKLYEAGSKAVRDANPDAVVGGPALAFDPSWVDPFLDQAVAKKIPLDFFSFHYYPGIPFEPADLPGRVRLMEQSLDKRPALRTTQLHLNEFNSYKIDYPLGGKQDKIPIAAAFLHDVKWFLEQPGLTRVHWAQYQDSGGGNFSGAISMDGHRKALFNAMLLYQRMPVDRRKLTIDSPDVEGFASGDNSAADVLLWNQTDGPRRLSLHLMGLTSKQGTVTRLDADHGSWGDHPDSENKFDSRPVSVPDDGNLDLEVPGNGVVRIELGSPDDPAVPAGQIKRDWIDYPNRTGKSYCDVDKRTWTIREGSAGDADASCTGGFTADGLPDSVAAKIQSDGRIIGGVVGIRIDFHSPAGKNRSVFFHGPEHFIAGDPVDIPWGTGRPVDQTLGESDFSKFRIDFGSVAPPDWDHRADFTVVMRKAGPTARVAVSFSK